MARLGTKILDSNDPFPEIEMKLISGEKLKLPQDAGDGYAVIFFYRGYW